MDRAELRRLAEEAIKAQDNIFGPYNDETAVAWGKALQAYTKAANPCAIIEILDKLEAAEKVCEEAAKLNNWLKAPAESGYEWDVRQSWKEKWGYVVAVINEWQGR